MKITSSKEEQKFEPIIFNITVESKEELEALRGIFGVISAGTIYAKMQSDSNNFRELKNVSAGMIGTICTRMFGILTAAIK